MEKLHEIFLPDPVSWMPQTTGWYAILGVLLLIMGWWGYKRLRRFQKNQYRRVALAELAVLERDLRQPEKRGKALAEIPALLKGTALSAYPRTDIASLSGEKWLAFLDQSMGGKEFREGQGRLLAELAYAPSARISNLPDETIIKLLQLVRLWIKKHAVRTSGE